MNAEELLLWLSCLLLLSALVLLIVSGDVGTAIPVGLLLLVFIAVAVRRHRKGIF